MKLITLDPATHNTGYAIWNGPSLVQYGVVSAHKSSSWDVRCLELNSKIRNLIVENRMTFCIGEFPEYQNGQRGRDAATGGDTLKLAYLCGAISTGWQLHAALWMSDRHHHIITTETAAQPEPLVMWVSPSKWKGQLPKKVCAERCFSKYGWKAVSDFDLNASDAIMIGDWYWTKLVHEQPTANERCKQVNL